MFYHKYLNRYTIILACILLSVLLNFGCSNYFKPNTLCDPPTLSLNEIPPVPSKELVTDIYFDSTLSMQGFISDSGSSYYQQTIAALERPIISSGGQVNFFEFGSEIDDSKSEKTSEKESASKIKIKPLPDRSYREANKKSFYADPKKKTFIQDVLSSANKSHLNIVITDLFQDQTDIDLLSKQISNNFIREGYAVGVFGIKSQFEGKIYDVGRNNYSFDYKNDEDTKSHRPFYILAFGQHSDIANYFSKIADTEIPSNSEKHIVIFSKFLISKITSISQAETLDIRGLNEVDGVFVKDSGNNSNFKEFNIIKNTDANFYNTKLAFDYLPYIPNFTQITPVITTCKCQSKEPSSINSNYSNNSNSLNNYNSNLPNENIVNDLQVSDALVVSLDSKNGDSENKPENPDGNGSINANNISQSATVKNNPNEDSSNSYTVNLTAKVLPEKLEANSINCFHIILYPEKYSLPGWVSEWNLTDQEIEIWNKTKNTYKGKTYNLVPFLQTILNSTIEEHKPKVADFYFYLKQN